MQTIKALVQIGKAVSDPTRVRLLACLAVRELCVCELVHLMDIGQPAVSRHLRILREAGLIDATRDGQFVNYSLLQPVQTAFGQAVLDALTEQTETDPHLRDLAERTLVVDRIALRCAPPAVITFD